MPMIGALLQRLWALCILLLLGATTSAVADPRAYGQFAQHTLDKDITVTFATPESVKQRLDAGTPQWLVDVRSRASYDATHLPGAVSLPLETLPHRFVEIPRDIPVVLY
jgi:hypothetical protein